MKKRKASIIKLLLLSLAAVMCLCSCTEIGNAASGIVSAALDSAGNEISNAISDGMGDLSDGIDDIKKGLNEASNEIQKGVTEASSNVQEVINSMSESLDSLADEISAKIESGIAEGSVLISSLNEKTAAVESPEATVSSDDTTTAPRKEYKFRSKKLYEDHYKKHGKEFGNITKEEYLSMANDLINSTSASVLHKTSKDGDYLYFDQDTGYFLVLSDDGYIRTFFIPDRGKAYYDKQ